MALRQHGEGLDAYMDKFMELYAQVPDMSPQDSLAIYLGGIEASVRIHLLGAQHVYTLDWHWKRRVYMQTRTVVLWSVHPASMRLGTTPWI